MMTPEERKARRAAKKAERKAAQGTEPITAASLAAENNQGSDPQAEKKPEPKTLLLWPASNNRSLATCPLCNEQHQAPAVYLTRHARHAYTDPDSLKWLTEHSKAFGLTTR